MNHITSLNDQDFKERLEACIFPVSDFDHRSHLRLAYVYLTENSIEVSNKLVRSALNRLLQHNNIEPTAKYHETLTKAWLLVVNHYMKGTKDLCSADEFIDKNPELLNSQIMMTHYTHEILFSDRARKKFIKPDLKEIPV